MDSLQTTFCNGRLYTAGQVRELDRCAIEDHGIAGLELMERAGEVAFNVIRQEFQEKKRWLILCGGGNNGGDGYVVARLAQAAGIECHIHALKSPEELGGDAALAARKWLESGGRVEMGAPGNVANHDLLVDALLGTGLDRTAEGEYARAISILNGSSAPVAAIDVPSGLNSDSGCAMGGLAVRADLTITFIGLKRGLFTADGPDHTGSVHYDSLNVPESVFDAIFNSGELIRENIVAKLLPRRLRNSHKGHYGWLLGVGGDDGMSGALRLCGEAGLRSGAGKVTLLTHPAHAAILNAGCPELMVRGVSDAGKISSFLSSANVLALGPGLGQSEWSQAMFRASRDFTGPAVLDADALNLVAAEKVLEKVNASGSEMVLTPHPYEAARLLDTKSSEVQGDRVGAARELAQRSQAIVVLKGCGTVVARPNGDYAICPLGNPGMASGGTGDVLTGVIAAMLAQGLDAWSAAQAGTVVHAAAGDRAALKFGEIGLIASDIINMLPSVLNPDS